ncbi:(2Fe-2S)-binding protein [Desulfobulbus rhabdoformis]|jgi:isoquinoline 1-oxidoreductase alpha subunit|uniref:(2Fe-2S)-binding protein n=1 Tax=Desulfobulbus rhabdoformis TaxID=34032 RepID=UPI0019650E63|nr:(2Fe-2S)-binding protein [Desulfobulbus rhabdoformis]MBM9616569.1 (2Fe-2S)-binding protein [Desulfobulbus rhabdoformis]
MFSLTVNGEKREIEAAADTPLLWVLRDTLGITSVKYTCGVGECGMCTVLMNGTAQRSCVITLEESAGSSITTIEGLPDEHPIKQAWIEHQVPQCGYCQPGIMLQAVDFLTRVPNPTETQINQAMDDVICRCGSHARMKVALKDAVNTLNQKQGG